MTVKPRRRKASFRLESLETRTLLSVAGWQGYAQNPQHTALSTVASQTLGSILWQSPVDLNPQYKDNALLIHYGSPLITASNTVIIPVKTGTTSGFEIQARSGSSGSLQWTLTSDYALQPGGYDWIPSFSPTLTPENGLYYPADGGTVMYTASPDAAGPAPPATSRLAFFGLSHYNANPSGYNSNVFIDTPITTDSSGDIFFGFIANAGNTLGLTSGVARIGANGVDTWAPVVPGMSQVATNSAPALSNDGSTLYVLESTGNWGWGKLVALNSQTLTVTAQVTLIDPHTGNYAYITNDGTASPMVGPDGDVYIGVVENPDNPPSNNGRGWLLHFSGDLSQTKTPGAFGWDDTPSVVPSSMVPSYHGTSTYLLMVKYNNYAGAGSGNGLNKIAILDPNDETETDPVTGTTVMNPVLSILGQTPDPDYDQTYPGAVDEWCINSAVVDPATDSILAGNEDGKLYRWNLTSDSITQVMTLTTGIGEAYTPTLIGPDGVVYAINNATLFAVGDVTAASLTVTGFPSAVTAGRASNLTVTVYNAEGDVDSAYAGTVSFTSSDLHAGLPANYTFVAADRGTHTFSATLETVGTQYLTATDTTTSSITGTQSGIIVLAAGAQPPTLAPVPNQAMGPNPATLTVTLNGSDPDGDPLTYAATAETQTYWLRQTYGIYEDAGGYYTNYRGQQEKYLRGKVSANGYSNGGGDFWYYILPNGDLYEFTPPYTTKALTGALVADLGVAVYNDPSLLWNAQNAAVPVMLTVSGNQLTITPGSGYTGTFVVIAGVNDGFGNSASQAFTVAINTPPTLAPVPNQTMGPNPATLTVTLNGSDPDGDTLTYAATAETQTSWLQQTYLIYEDAGGYYNNYRGQQEKYLRGRVSADGYSNGGGDFWYYILPSGGLYEFTPPYTTTALTGVLVADVGVAVYNDPSLLWNAQNTAVPVTLTVSGNVLTIAPGAGYTGTFVVIASVNDGFGNSASQAFKVAIHTPPTLAPVPNQTMGPNPATLTVTLNGSDPDRDPLAYAATAETQAYWLQQTYGIYEDAGGYYTNYRGQQEKYLRGTVSANGYTNGGGDFWYYILPNGDLYEFTPPYTTMALTGALVADVGVAVYNDPSLLWDAQNTAVPVTPTVSGNVLTIAPGAGYTGTFVVIASVNDGFGNSASQAFTVAINPPTLAPVPNQTMGPNPATLTVTLNGSDPDGDPLTYAATAETQTYWLRQTYGIYEDAGGYYTNYRGQQEKYLRGKVSANGYSNGGGDFWYYILPNGDLYEFTPTYTTTTLTGVLVADVGVAVYNDPSLLWNASNVAVPVTLGVSGNELTITPNAGFTGVFYVIAAVTDGHATASRAFQVTVTS